MPDWLDSDTLIQPSRTYYSFALVPSFWSYLDRKVQEQVFAAPERVFGELKEVDDDLNAWATNVQESFFRQPSEEVQRVFGQIADSVKADHRFAQHHVARFLAKADAWLIAHAAVEGGHVVTFEKRESQSTKPKIPDVADHYGVKCINLFELLTELGASF